MHHAAGCWRRRPVPPVRPVRVEHRRAELVKAGDAERGGRSAAAAAPTRRQPAPLRRTHLAKEPGHAGLAERGWGWQALAAPLRLLLAQPPRAERYEEVQPGWSQWLLALAAGEQLLHEPCKPHDLWGVFSSQRNSTLVVRAGADRAVACFRDLLLRRGLRICDATRAGREQRSGPIKLSSLESSRVHRCHLAVTLERTAAK